MKVAGAGRNLLLTQIGQYIYNFRRIEARLLQRELPLALDLVVKLACLHSAVSAEGYFCAEDACLNR